MALRKQMKAQTSAITQPPLRTMTAVPGRLMAQKHKTHMAAHKHIKTHKHLNTDKSIKHISTDKTAHVQTIALGCRTLVRQRHNHIIPGFDSPFDFLITTVL